MLPNNKALECLKIFEDYKSIRMPLENSWRSVALACLPRDAGAWNFPQGGGYVNPSVRTANQTAGAVASAQLSVDTTAARALPKYTALLMKLLTPTNIEWHDIVADDASLMNIKAVADYFYKVKETLFNKRYEASAGFAQCQAETYTQLGAYGSGIKYVAKDIVNNGIIYKAISDKDCWYSVDNNNRINTIFRSIPNMNEANIRRAFGDDLPSSITDCFGNNVNETFEIIHMVTYNDKIDNDSFAVDKKYKYVGRYIFVKAKEFIGDTEGFNTMPYIVARDFSDPGIAYGYSPGLIALPSIGSANKIKISLLQIGEKMANPPVLAFDNNSINGRISLNPGAVNYGGLDQNGRELIKPIPIGDYQAGQLLLQAEQQAINDAFYVNLYDLINQPDSSMTATEVLQRENEKATLLSPLMERISNTDLGPLIDREIEILYSLRLLPQPPPELIGKKYKIIYKSPLSKSLKNDDISAYMRLLQWASQQAQVAGDPTIIARFNVTQAIKDIGYSQGIPPTWFNDDQTVAAMQQQQQQSQLADQASKAAPAIAGIAKAQALSQQAGAGQPKNMGNQINPSDLNSIINGS